MLLCNKMLHCAACWEIPRMKISGDINYFIHAAPTATLSILNDILSVNSFTDTHTITKLLPTTVQQ